MRILIIIVVLLLTGCKNDSIYSKTTIQGNLEAANFIIECVKTANTLADGEDLVYQCENTAEKIFGTPQYYGTHSGYYICKSFSYEETRRCVTKHNL